MAVTFNQRKLKKNLFLVACLTIPVIHWFVFWLYININSFVLSFQNLLGEWVGWKNYQWYWTNLTSPNPAVDMGLALRNTLLCWVWNICITSPLCLAFSYFFYKKIAGYKAYRIISYIPTIIGSMVMVSAFKGAIRSGGPLDAIVQSLGGEPIPKFLYDTRYAFTTCLIYDLWDGFGISLILYSGAMNRIPQEVVEYAYLDGVNPLQEFVHITFPLIWETWSMKFILSIGDLFTGSSGPVFLLTNGQYGTINISFSMFQQVYSWQQVNRAATIGSIFTLLGVPLVLFSRWVLNKIRKPEEY